MNAPKLFGEIADAIREVAECNGYSIYVSTNYIAMTLTEDGYVGGGEFDVSVKVREKPVAEGPK